MKHPVRLVLAFIPLALVLAACGGGGSGGGGDVSGSSGGNGGVAPAIATGTMTVIWPPRDRAIPAAANSLVVKLSSGGSVVATKTIARPAAGNTTTTASFTGLPVGALAVAVSAFPNTDGTGQAQALGSGTMTTAVGTPGAVTVSLVSTVASIAVTPSPLSLGVGTASTVTAAAKDASNNIVLLSAGGGTETLTWTSDNTSIATVAGSNSAPTAIVSALANGTANIRATLVTNDTGTTVGGTTATNVVSTSGTVTIK